MDTKLPSLRDPDLLRITTSGQIPESQVGKPTVFVSTDPIFPIKDTKREMRGPNSFTQPTTDILHDKQP